MKGFEVFLINFGYFLQETYATITEAKAAGDACGFQYVVFDADGKLCRTVGV